MAEEEKKAEVETAEPPEAVKSILRSFGRAGGAETRFAYTLNIPGVCMVSFVCDEDNAEKFIAAARNEAMALIGLQGLQVGTTGDEIKDGLDGDGPPPNSYYG